MVSDCKRTSTVNTLCKPLFCLYQVHEPLFVWTDLSEKDVQLLRQSGMDSPNSTAILQKAATQSTSRTDLQQQIELELYKQTLRQGKVILRNSLR